MCPFGIDRCITLGVVIRRHIAASDPEHLSWAGDISEHLSIYTPESLGRYAPSLRVDTCSRLVAHIKKTRCLKRFLLNHRPNGTLAKCTSLCGPHCGELAAKL